MKKILAMLLCAMMVLSACGGDSSAKTNYKTLYSSEVTTLNYLNATTEDEFKVPANTIDCLIEYDSYGIARPGLAESWTVSDDGLVWTFDLRKGVKWMTHEGKEYGKDVVAQDFVDAMYWVLNPNNASKTAQYLYGVILNAQQAFEGQLTDVTKIGVKALDTYKLEYTLERPVPYFESILTNTFFMPVNGEFLAEKGDAFGTDNTNLLYCGAYILKSFKPQEERILVKNNKYWDKDKVYIEQLTYTYNMESKALSPEMFLRGEVSEALITTEVLTEWLKDETKASKVRPSRTGSYTYFYALNFDPQFDEQYEPANWKLAVNNLNFRKSLFHALDRKVAMITDEPYNPQSRLINTIVPPGFADYDGIDYTQSPDLIQYTVSDSFNGDLAKSFKDAAVPELQAAGVTLPVKVLMPYNPQVSNWDKRCQVIEQQMEALLGADYIDIIVEAGPAQGFLAEVRRTGKFAFMECNWGPDYADPETYTEPFDDDSSYGKPLMAEGYDVGSEHIYTTLLKDARAELTDKTARYNNFAKAEAFLIENAMVIPYAVNSPGYYASLTNPFEGQFSPFGISILRYKGQRVLEKPMDMTQFEKARESWIAEREAKIKLENK